MKASPQAFFAVALPLPATPIRPLKWQQKGRMQEFAACLLLSWLFLSPIQAQNSMLEHIGASEVEVYYHIDDEGSRTMRKEGEVLTVSDADLKAQYILERGKVTEVHLDQRFDTAPAAEKALAEALKVCQDRGLGMKAVQGGAGRILRGEGNGLRSSLVLTSQGEGYRFEAQIVAMR
jgi:hypothetical protein